MYFFAGFAALSLLTIPFSLNAWINFLLTALFIQLRLLCNLFDGMVAVEGEKSTPSGELFNDIPDRIADALIIVSAGYAVNFIEFAWLAGLLSMMTAYTRTLATAVGAPTNFCGPMAKQHRMAILTICCLLSPFESSFLACGSLMKITLVIIVIGSLITVYRRAKAAYT